MSRKTKPVQKTSPHVSSRTNKVHKNPEPITCQDRPPQSQRAKQDLYHGNFHRHSPSLSKKQGYPILQTSGTMITLPQVEPWNDELSRKAPPVKPAPPMVITRQQRITPTPRLVEQTSRDTSKTQSSVKEALGRMESLRLTTSVVEQQEAIWRQIKEDNAKKQLQTRQTAAQKPPVLRSTYAKGQDVHIGLSSSRPSRLREVEAGLGSRGLHVAAPYQRNEQHFDHTDRSSQSHNNHQNFDFLPGQPIKVIQQADVIDAMRRGQAKITSCFVCAKKLIITKEMTIVYCPGCGSLSPMGPDE